MDSLFLEIFKYLTTSLAPIELIVALIVIAVLAFFIINFLLKRKNALKSLFGKGDEDLNEINKKLSEVATREDLDKMKLIIAHGFESIRQDSSAFKDKFIEVSSIRHTIVEKELSQIALEITESRRFIAAQHHESAEQQALILSTSNKLAEEQARILGKVGQLDEYLKAVIPEFRTYHRDLDDDIKLLGRDLAVIERSMQLSLNSNSGVKLR